jgi:murein DD-endopeptidase MepM/ murein hydrolase activator NlpD
MLALPLALLLSTPPATPAPAIAPPPAITERGGWRALEAVVKGSLAGSIASAIPGEGSVVAAHTARIFMWDLDVRQDVTPGDRVAVLWRRDPSGEVEVGAATYVSAKLRRTLRAYRFTGAGDRWASYWDEAGREVPRTLKSGPLHAYEQITALLKDRPTHQGMDFKVPVGTPVHAPRAGLVSRVDWKLRGNGHCLELQLADGVAAKFLHLSEIKAARGARVAAGQIIALTGNTGHSTAPHLHYQLGRGGRTLDPVDYHGTTRRHLAGDTLRAFEKARAALDQLLAAR